MFVMIGASVGSMAGQALMQLQTVFVALWLWQEAQPPPAPEQPAYNNWFSYIWNEYINEPLRIGETLRVSLASLTLGILIIILAFAVSRSVCSLIENRLANRTHIDPSIQYTIQRLLHYFIVVIGLLLAFRTAFNADLMSLAVIFTALSIGIGFGLQFIAGDIASGFILLFERPVRVGDFVKIKGGDREVEGRVRSINLRTTVVVTNDNIAVIVPNSQLVSQNLVNWSYGSKNSRLAIPVGVTYGADVELVTKTLLRAAEDINFVLTEPKPSVQFLEFGESSLDFRLLVWTDRPRRHPQIKSAIRYRIWTLFKEAGIEIPFPQRDLHLRSGTLQMATQNGHLRLQAGDGAEEDAEPPARSSANRR